MYCQIRITTVFDHCRAVSVELPRAGSAARYATTDPEEGASSARCFKSRRACFDRAQQGMAPSVQGLQAGIAFATLQKSTYMKNKPSRGTLLSRRSFSLASPPSPIFSHHRIAAADGHEAAKGKFDTQRQDLFGCKII